MPGANPKNQVEDDSLVYFQASDGLYGAEFWRRDGTPQGTFLVKDMAPFEQSTDLPPAQAKAGELLYFRALSSESGVELWATDELPGSAWQVVDLNTGSNSSHPQHLMQAGRVCFSWHTIFRQNPPFCQRQPNKQVELPEFAD